MTADPDELRRQLADKTAAAERQDAAAGKHSRVDSPTLEMRLAEVQKKLRADEQAIASVRGQQSTLHNQLSPSWSDQCDHLDMTVFDALDAERERLAVSGMVEQFRTPGFDPATLRQQLVALQEMPSC